MGNRKKEPLERRAFDLPRLTLDDLAEAVRRRRVTASKYRDGTREMPAEIRGRLASYLEAHAKRLLDLARELRASV